MSTDSLVVQLIEIADNMLVLLLRAHSMTDLQQQDPDVYAAIQAETHRQNDGLELIASENFVSPAVMEAQGSVFTNKYAEGLPGKRYYGGCEFADVVEDLARDRAKQLFGAAWCNVQPHSGAQANAAVYLAVLKPGDRLLGLDLAHGGHLTHGSPVNFSGILYDAHFYGVEADGPLAGRLDMDRVRQRAREVQPKMLSIGASAYTRDFDYAAFRSIADEVGALLWMDVAHTAGLVVGGVLTDPVPHCHIVTTTTHKTLRGPRGGLILMGQDFDNPFGKVAPKSGRLKGMSELLDSAVFPGTQGGPLVHVIAAKAVALGEALQPTFKAYAQPGGDERAGDGRGLHRTRLHARLRRHRQPPRARGPALEGPHRQGSRGAPPGRRHHGEQEHGPVRHREPVRDERHPRRHPRHDHARPQGRRFPPGCGPHGPRAHRSGAGSGRQDRRARALRGPSALRDRMTHRDILSGRDDASGKGRVPR